MIFVVQFSASSSLFSRISLWPIFSGVVDCVFDDGGFRRSFLILCRIKKSHEIEIFCFTCRKLRAGFFEFEDFLQFWGKMGSLWYDVSNFLLLYWKCKTQIFKYLLLRKAEIFLLRNWNILFTIGKNWQKRVKLNLQKHIYTISAHFLMTQSVFLKISKVW